MRPAHSWDPLLEVAQADVDGADAPRFEDPRRDRLFYHVLLPLGVTANLVLGLFLLTGLQPEGWTDWLQLATGALCCAIAGWLAAAAWSRWYWRRGMVKQVAVWHRVVDVLLGWLQDVPVPVEALHRLKASLDEALPRTRRG